MKESKAVAILFECKDSAGNVAHMSDRVVVAPRMLAEFSRPLWKTNPFPSSFQTRPWSIGDWSWIDKGELLTELNINIMVGSWFRTKFVKVPIRSPASGLIINPRVDFDNNDCEDGFFNNQPQYGNIVKILLPASELVPDDASYMYGEFCDFCLKNKHLFLKKEYPWFKSDEFPNVVQRQRIAPMRQLSFTKDFGKEYLDEVLRKTGGT